MDPIKGFRDFEAEEAEKRQFIKGIIATAFQRYGFELAETPMIEYEEFVKGNSNQNPNEQDEAISDTFKLKDKGERNLALRYEFTFQLNRLARNKKLPYKRFQIGEVFRDEPASTVRFRQFTQCDADIIGSTIKDEAEVLAMAVDILKKLGIKFKIYFNNRKLLNELLDQEGIKEKDKPKVIREIDKLDKLPEKVVRVSLAKFKAEKFINVLNSKESSFKPFQSYKEIEELEKYCKMYGIEKNIEFKPSLARGLSYYNGTIFEIKAIEKEFNETIVAGGSYMINNMQSTGISFGLERLSIISALFPKFDKIAIISIDEDKKAVELTKILRDSGKRVTLFYGKPSKALEYANSKSFTSAIFIGKDEAKLKKVKVRDLKSGKEKLISEKDLMKELDAKK